MIYGWMSSKEHGYNYKLASLIEYILQLERPNYNHTH